MRTVMSYELSDRLPRIPSVIGIQGIPRNLSLKRKKKKKKKNRGKALWILCLVRKSLSRLTKPIINTKMTLGDLVVFPFERSKEVSFVNYTVK